MRLLKGAGHGDKNSNMLSRILFDDENSFGNFHKYSLY